MAQSLLQRLIDSLARLPGLGPRSARRIAFHLLRHKDSLMTPLAHILTQSAQQIMACRHCGNWDECDPCHLCDDESRDSHSLCVVEQVSDLWALERAAMYQGRYFVLGGTLSVYREMNPELLRLPQLLQWIERHDVQEVILATNATVDGQMTADYIVSMLTEHYGERLRVSHLARGLPVGGELDYLDDGTLAAAFTERIRSEVESK